MHLRILPSTPPQSGAAHQWAAKGCWLGHICTGRVWQGGRLPTHRRPGQCQYFRGIDQHAGPVLLPTIITCSRRRNNSTGVGFSNPGFVLALMDAFSSPWGSILLFSFCAFGSNITQRVMVGGCVWGVLQPC